MNETLLFACLRMEILISPLCTHTHIITHVDESKMGTVSGHIKGNNQCCVDMNLLFKLFKKM
ncbi:CLUMA_CG010864, isoform A [Clunio marinus]|uniref:CLUMA_CG010864, isoform A n=1 Tax=Clunio marinus TaxID=568069 RepID=A0A1J1IB88_9DIPT|nr:CLUMA_CG010864, isoform A [Clunio marinus]